MSRLVVLGAGLALLGACTPAERVAGPVGWPETWDGRLLWSTPNAYIYATHGAAAGEIDRLVVRAREAYAAELGQPTPPVLIIVRDANTPLPGDDTRALLRCTLRMELERYPSAAVERDTAGAAVPAAGVKAADTHARSLDEQTEEALLALQAGALVTGSSLEVLVGTVPLTCDARALRDVCRAPQGLGEPTCGALILPTRACLRHHVRLTLQGTLRTFRIGVAAQVLFAPVLAMAEAKLVDQLDQLRDAALFSYWLFEHADLPEEEKRTIAAGWRERWASSTEEAAQSVAHEAEQRQPDD